MYKFEAGFGEDPEFPDMVELPEDLQKALIETAKSLIPEGASVEVTPMVMSAHGMLHQAITEMGPLAVVSALVAEGGTRALEHALHGECTHRDDPETVYDQLMGDLVKAVEAAKEHLRPVYLQAFEAAKFAEGVEAEIAGIETIDDAELAALIATYSHEEEE